MKILDKLFKANDSELIEEIIDAYIKRLNDGDEVNRYSVIANYPMIAIDLSNAMETDTRVKQAEARYLRKKPSSRLRRKGSSGVIRSAGSGGDGPPSAPPELVLDNFDVICEIGRGAMGRVYKAWDISAKRTVAIKTLIGGHEMGNSQRKRFGREALTQQKLRHPNIVEVYDYGMCDGIPYLVMEYIEDGKTLQSVLDDAASQLDEMYVARLMLAVARALSYSHVQEIVHRDIKPANIMLTGDTPKLTDFGLAFNYEAEMSRLTQSGEMLGTLCYMAPEQVDGSRGHQSDRPHASSDIYALGATMYEMLTGHIPFIAETPGEIIRQIIDEDVVEPAKLGVRLSKEIEAICIKCLEKEVENRYDTSSELVNDLDRYLNRKRVLAPRIRWPMRRFRRRLNKRRLAAAAMLVALLFIGLSVFIAKHYRFREQLNELRESRDKPESERPVFETPFLVKALKSSDLEARVSAVIALSRQENQMADAALLEAINDPHPNVRYRVANSLLDSDRTILPEICHRLLEDSENSLIATGISLAERLDDRAFLPKITTFAYGNDPIITGYAVKAALRILHTDNSEFLDTFMEKGDDSEKMKLLAYLATSRLPPPISVMIKWLRKSDNDEERKIIAEILTAVTHGDYGDDVDAWDQWYASHGESWRPRPVYTVGWAPGDSSLKSGDIIWLCNGQTPPKETRFSSYDFSRATVVRDNQFVELQGPFGNHKSQVFYIGMLNDQAVGATIIAERINRAMQSDAEGGE